jgi:hypothetical protein
VGLTQELLIQSPCANSKPVEWSSYRYHTPGIQERTLGTWGTTLSMKAASARPKEPTDLWWLSFPTFFSFHHPENLVVPGIHKIQVCRVLKSAWKMLVPFELHFSQCRCPEWRLQLQSRLSLNFV